MSPQRLDYLEMHYNNCIVWLCKYGFIKNIPMKLYYVRILHKKKTRNCCNLWLLCIMHKNFYYPQRNDWIFSGLNFIRIEDRSFESSIHFYYILLPFTAIKTSDSFCLMGLKYLFIYFENILQKQMQYSFIKC